MSEQAAAQHHEQSQRVPLSMSHIGLYVHDLPQMEDFYTRVMGFTVTDRGKVRGADIVFTSGTLRTTTKWPWSAVVPRT